MATSKSRPWAGRLLLFSMLACAGCGGDNTGGGAKPSGSSASGGGSSGEGPRLVFITNGSSDWWNAVEKGMTDGEAAFHAQVEMRRNDQGDPAGQIRLLEDVLSLPDVKGVAVSVMEKDSPGIAEKMKELTKAGKVVIAVNSDGQPETRRAYIGTLNRKAGEVAGRVARTLRPQGGKVVAFVGTAAAANALERREGFFAGTGEAFRTASTATRSRSSRMAPIRARPRSTSRRRSASIPMSGSFWGSGRTTRNYIAEEVAKAPEVRKKATVVTFDLDELAVNDVADGKIDATVCQNPYEMGYRGVRLLKAFVDNDKKTIDEMLPGGTDIIDTGVRVVVPKKDSPVQGDNVIDIEAMKKWLGEKGLKST